MYLKKIRLENYRNYKLQDIEFINGINLFLGPNAQGKTNIIESIYLSAIGKSYRTIRDNEVVSFDSEFCRINLEYFDEYDLDQKIDVYIDKNNKKQIKDNDVKINKLINHVGKLLIVEFSPDSLDIVKGSPQKRRKFIDEICSQVSKTYLFSLQEYMKLLKLKNNVLKTDKIDMKYLDILNEKMSEYIEKIVNYRKYIINIILEMAIDIHKSITNNKEIINIKYNSDFLDLNKEKIKNILDEYLKIEIIRKMSLKGIQRDDIEFYINDLEVSKFCSQGQNRTVLLTLKLANFELIKSQKQREPILLLDDIMSELDVNRIEYLLKYIKGYQSIITTTDMRYIKDIENIKIQKVLDGTLEII